MPFVASIAEDRKNNGLAPCSGPMVSGTWDRFGYDVRKNYCRMCPFRFMLQPNCSLDFLTIGEVDPFKEELASLLSWMSQEDPGWGQFNGCVHETDYAYHLIGYKCPSPKGVVEEFLKSCLDVTMSEGFWKEWNYVMVEGWQGKPARKKIISGPMRSAVEKIFNNVTEPNTYTKKRLYHLYAAAALLQDAAYERGFRHIQATFGSLTEACRRAVTANASLDIS